MMAWMGAGLVDPPPRGKERQVAPSLTSHLRASAIANTPTRTGRRRDSNKTSPRKYCALPSVRDRFIAPSASTRLCDAIASNQEYTSPCFDLLLAIKGLSRYPDPSRQPEPLALPAFLPFIGLYF